MITISETMKTMQHHGLVDIGHHFESCTVATTTWLTAMEYLCHKWPRIYFNGRKHFPVLSSFVTFLRILIKQNIRLLKYTNMKELIQWFKDIISWVHRAYILWVCLLSKCEISNSHCRAITHFSLKLCE